MRSNYQGIVRNSRAETLRDTRMLELANHGLAVSIIAQRMGITTNSARKRIQQARAALTQAEGIAVDAGKDEDGPG